MTLEAYAKARKEFRARVIEHKKPRTVHLGEHVTLLFEDELTVRYQIQEMLRIEKIFEADGIAQEIQAYAPLVPKMSKRELWRRVRVAIEFGFAVDEMLNEEDRIKRNDIIREAARMLQWTLRDPE